MTHAHHALRRAALTAATVLLLLGLAASPAAAVAPTAGFTFSPASPREGDEVTFTSSAAPGTPGDTLTETWSFGGSGATAKHTFTVAGPVSVTLTVTNQLAETATATHTVDVVANKPPVASFSTSPPIPNAGEKVTFTSTSTDPEGKPLKFAWDTNDNGTTDATTKTASRTFARPGIRTVRLTVTDDLGATDTVTGFITVNALPVASIGVTPARPIAGDTVTFSSKSTDSDGTVASQAWDLDHDGAFDDGSGINVQRAFAAAGSYIVGLRVTDDRGAVSSTTQTVTVVPNQPPSVAFTAAPGNPLAGAVVTFTSSASDPDGRVAEQVWDLDGDGAFDDARGASARRTFASAGSFEVGLRATDNKGAATIAVQRIVVGETPKAPSGQFTSIGTTPSALAPNSPRALAGLLSPFPIVTLRGRLTSAGARIDGLEITQLPLGARVEVRCRGRGCPFRSKTRRARGRSRTVRFPELTRRRLRAGAVLRVLVTQPGKVGKYTTFRIRRSGAPVRKDLCLSSNGRRPRKCTR